MLLTGNDAQSPAVLGDIWYMRGWVGGRTGRFGESIRGTEGQEGAQTAEGVAALQLDLGKLEDGGRGRFGLIAVDPACCGLCLHCSGHVPSGEGMEDTWHCGSQHFSSAQCL